MKTEESKSKSLEEFWDHFSPVYSSLTEPYNSPLALQLALQAKAQTAKAVLEVACGSGLGSLIIRPLLQPGTTYCCCDLSKGMLETFQKRYKSSDFVKNPDNTLEFYFDETPGKTALKGKTETGVSLMVFKANNEALPFENDSFDSYIASGSLYVVDSPENMLKEAYRVLKPDGAAGFAVFGKHKDSTYFNVASELLEKYAKKYNYSLPKRRSLFYLGEDETKLKMMCKEAGFSTVKIWHQYCVYQVTAKEYAEEKSFPMGRTLKGFLEEAQKEFFDSLIKEVQEKLIEPEDALVNIDFLMVLCYK